MLFLSGVWNREMSPLFEDGTLGLLTTPRSKYRPSVAKIWAADNGCFGKGYPGDAAYLEWLANHSAHASRCLFATAPDVVGDAEATLDRSLPMLPKIRALGYPAALVAQDGLEHLTVPWDQFDVLFVGGSTEWKLSPAAARLLREAKARGKRTHMGRVNYGRRIRYAKGLDAVDSIDGTRLRFGADVHLGPLLAALGDPQHQGLLL
jgi:hypothetical protein